MGKKVHCQQCCQHTNFVDNLATFQTPLVTFSRKESSDKICNFLNRPCLVSKTRQYCPMSMKSCFPSCSVSGKEEQLKMQSVSEKIRHSVASKFFFWVIILHVNIAEITAKLLSLSYACGDFSEISIINHIHPVVFPPLGWNRACYNKDVITGKTIDGSHYHA